MDAGTSASVRGAGPRLARVLPDQRVQAVGQAERGARVGDRRVDLGPVADDAGVGDQPGDVRVAERGHGGGVEPGEGGAEVLPLAQDRRARTARTGRPPGRAARRSPRRRAAGGPIPRRGRRCTRAGSAPTGSAASRPAPRPRRRRSPALLLGRGHRFVVLLAGRVALGLLFARGFLLLGPPAVRVEGALRTGRVVRSRGRGGLGRVVLFPGIRENRRGLGRLVAFGLGPEALRTSGVCGGAGTGTVAAGSVARRWEAAARWRRWPGRREAPRRRRAREIPMARAFPGPGEVQLAPGSGGCPGVAGRPGVRGVLGFRASWDSEASGVSGASWGSRAFCGSRASTVSEGSGAAGSVGGSSGSGMVGGPGGLREEGLQEAGGIESTGGIEGTGGVGDRGRSRAPGDAMGDRGHRGPGGRGRLVIRSRSRGARRYASCSCR